MDLLERGSPVVENVKRRRFYRSIASRLMPMLALSVWLGAAPPLAAQAGPPPSPTSVLVYGFCFGTPDIQFSRLSRDQDELGLSIRQTVSEDLAGLLASETKWQVSAFHPKDAFVRQRLDAGGVTAAMPGPGSGLPPPGTGETGPETGGPGTAPSPATPVPGGDVGTPETGQPGAAAGAPNQVLPPVTAPAPAVPVPAPAGAPVPVPQGQDVGAPAPAAAPCDDPTEPALAARALGFRFVIVGRIDSVTYDETKHSATVVLTATIYDTMGPRGLQVAATPFSVTGRSKDRRVKLGASEAEQLALHDAERQLSGKIVGSGILPKQLLKKHGGSHTSLLSILIPVVVGVAAIAILASNHGGSSHPANNGAGGNGTGGKALLPPGNAIAEVAPYNGGFPVDLSFTPSASGNSVQRYDITRTSNGGSTVITSIPSVTGLPTYTWADSSITPGQAYTYSVQAIGYNGETSASVTFQTPQGTTLIVPGQPAAPVGLSVTGASASSVTLQWAPSTSAFTAGYQVFRSSQATGNFILISPSVTTPTYTDHSPDLVEGVTYYYKVRAVSAAGPPISSPDSNVVVVTLP